MFCVREASIGGGRARRCDANRVQYVRGSSPRCPRVVGRCSSVPTGLCMGNELPSPGEEAITIVNTEVYDPCKEVRTFQCTGTLDMTKIRVVDNVTLNVSSRKRGNTLRKGVPAFTILKDNISMYCPGSGEGLCREVL